MTKVKEQRLQKVTYKRTGQGGAKPKTSSMNKHQRRGYKAYRGQGK
jgi:hypothetical protein